MARALIALVLALTFSLAAHAQQAVSLLDPKEPNRGWSFGNGPEFKGATGKLVVDPEAQFSGKDSLKLEGDFTKGGAYVHMTRNISDPALDVRDLAITLKAPGIDAITVRVGDGSGQCHQLRLRLAKSDDFQTLKFPLERFFAKLGNNDAGASVAKYEYWGGAKDGKWHAPLKYVSVITNPSAGNKTPALWINDVTVLPKPAAAAESSAGDVPATVRLDEVLEGTHDWNFSLGQEFKGAKGSLTLAPDQPEKGRNAFVLAGDFTGGGAYVGMGKSLKDLEAKDVQQIRMKAKSDNCTSMGLQIIDGTGQCHQLKGVKIVADGQWHEMVIKPAAAAGGEHWGGANDGKWHNPCTSIFININPGSDSTGGKKPALMLADIAADILVAAVVKPASFKCDFENLDQLPAAWSSQGTVTIDKNNPFAGKAALCLNRPAEQVEKPCTAAGPSFPATPGLWELALAVKSDLHSPDSSYSGTVALECLDTAGKVLDRVTLADVFGSKNWQPISKRAELPKATVAARFQMQLNKADGRLWVDDLSASFVSAAAKKDRRIARIVFTTAQMGNLLLAQDKKTVDVSVDAVKPLAAGQLELTYVVRDYWGAEQGPAGKITLTKAGKKGNFFSYTGTFDLATYPLEIGRYYEIHAQVPQDNDEPFANHTGIAILPEAITKQYKAEEVPFTSRNWDNRIGEYITLTDRLGVRIVGIWGGWSAEPPYTPNAPSIDIAAKLGLGVLTGTPCHAIEYHLKGYEKYDEKALRSGVRNWLEKYSKVASPIVVNLGNEPHGKGEQVLENVRAYKAVYEEIKAVNPNITVVATSVEPNEEYFQAGYYKYCDAFDFHVYEDAVTIRHAIKHYQDLMAKYNCKKPIWSTELGLNSQGMSRQAISAEIFRKAAAFFAAGGSSFSWFDLLYPDPEGKSLGSSGESMNVFDSRYNRYNPKLDAVAYYNMVNAICIKKFVEEKTYDNGVYSCLFRDRDNKALQILWKEKGRADTMIPLPGVDAVEVIRIDGRRSTLSAGSKGITLSVSDDPMMLLYTGGSAKLAEKLGAPAAKWSAVPSAMVRGGATKLAAVCDDVKGEGLSLAVPPLWKAEKAVLKTGVEFTVNCPEAGAAREADLILSLTDDAGHKVGELSCRPPVTGQLTLAVLPTLATDGKTPAVQLAITNNGSQNQDVSWDITLLGERSLKDGNFGPMGNSAAYFAQAPRGSLVIEGGKQAIVAVPLAGVQPLNVYGVRATVTDASGRMAVFERCVSGFVNVPRASGSIKLDGVLSEADWQRAPVQRLDQKDQYFCYDKKAEWKGPQDLSGTLQFLWDDQYLYVGVKVTDDVFTNDKADGGIWQADGLQFLIDPKRDSNDKPGKYDYVMAVGSKGPQAWCSLSADPGAPNGEAKDIIVSGKRTNDKTGDMTYKIAIPWSRLAPFKPGMGANLGLSMIINEDDGNGRHSFITWFGNPHTKQVDVVGDLMLGK